MAKKGLSFEEKQRVLLQVLLKKNSFFNLKEIEKIGSDAGIVFQSVKDVLQALVDDNLVKTDKIGNQNIYWALSSDAVMENVRKHEAFLLEKEMLEKKINELNSKVEFRSSLNYGTQQEREDVKLSIESLEKDITVETPVWINKSFYVFIQEMEKEIQFRRTYSTKSIRMLKQQVVMLYESSSRWADNICISRSWLKQQFPSICEADINEHFDIPSDLA